MSGEREGAMATLRLGKGAERRSAGGRPSLATRIWRDRWMYAFILPGFIYFIVFVYVPFLFNIIAWKDYSIFQGVRASPWVGWENFERLLTDQDFHRALTNTIQIEALQLIFAFPAPLALALLLHSIISDRVKRGVQSIVYLPHFLSWVIVIALWQQTFGGAGFINQLLANQGFDRINIMGNPDFFKPLVVLQSIWKEIGWGTIIFLAALTRIDTQLYEAAVIDGANGRRRLLDVTLPGIMGIIILLLILRMGSMFSTGFEQYFLQRNAVGPEAAEVIDTYVYYSAFQGGDWSFSATVGLVRGAVAAIMILGANWLARKITGEGLF
ncbi:MAG TPA: ABC transporter permease subunit [Thermomicrobiales bacterium]|nr:ABC transporter permease subunit [Thermomicrobiales bacterium]